MSIPAISAATTGVSPAGLLQGLGGVEQPSTAQSATSGTGFAASLGSSIDSLQQMQTTTKSLAVKAVTGDLDDVHDYTVAAAESKLALELTATLRNKAVEAFTEIMRMQA
jgi:flagellar hook-basal body complex protein FliE